METKYPLAEFVTFSICSYFLRYWLIAGMGEIRNAYKILVGKPVGKRPLGRPR
jgi:hypothetical protein